MRTDKGEFDKMNGNAWWNEAEEVIEKLSLLKHPFYQAWQAGRLSLDDLRCYAAQYYPHVAAFPRYVSAVHANCGDLETRRMLLENLIEEERGGDNHPELWLRFARGLGLSREAVQAAEPRPETGACVETFLALTREGSVATGLAALYAYESQIPAVSRTKMQGLEAFYGMKDARAQAFFRVHAEADVRHSEAERKALLRTAKTPEERAEAVEAARRACEAVWKLLDGVCEAQGIGVSC